MGNSFHNWSVTSSGTSFNKHQQMIPRTQSQVCWHTLLRLPHVCAPRTTAYVFSTTTTTQGPRTTAHNPRRGNAWTSSRGVLPPDGEVEKEMGDFMVTENFGISRSYFL